MYTHANRDKNIQIKERGKKKRKNHIQFAYLVKWFDSLVSLVELPSVATEIRTGRWTKKENEFEKRFGVATIVILENYEKPWK